MLWYSSSIPLFLFFFSKGFFDIAESNRRALPFKKKSFGSVPLGFFGSQIFILSS